MTGDARRGRRDNGLVAAEYAAAGDVDPRIGEHLLDVLGLDGIAAYLRPSTDLHPVTRSSSLPNRPTDRLYVDRAHLQTARALLERLAEESNPPASAANSSAAAAGPGEPASDRDLDDAWAEIIAGFDDEIDLPSRPWPSAEDVTEPAQPSRTVTDRRSEPAREPYRDDDADEPSLLDGLDTFGANLPDDEEENFTPPSAPPVPRPSLPTALGVAGIVLGLIVFLKPDLLPFRESLSMFLGFAGVVGGFATLVWRLRPGDEDDIDHDDGARV